MMTLERPPMMGIPHLKTGISDLPSTIIGERLNPGGCLLHDWSDDQLRAIRNHVNGTALVSERDLGYGLGDHDPQERNKIPCLCVTRRKPTQRFLGDLKRKRHTCLGTVAGALTCEKCSSERRLPEWKPIVAKLVERHECNGSPDSTVTAQCAQCIKRGNAVRAQYPKPYAWVY